MLAHLGRVGRVGQPISVGAGYPNFSFRTSIPSSYGGTYTRSSGATQETPAGLAGIWRQENIWPSADSEDIQDGWTLANGATASDATTLNFAAAATSQLVETGISLQAGLTYTIEAEISSATAKAFKFFFDDGASQEGGVETPTTGAVKYSAQFLAASTTAAGIAGVRNGDATAGTIQVTRLHIFRTPNAGGYVRTTRTGGPVYGPGFNDGLILEVATVNLNPQSSLNPSWGFTRSSVTENAGTSPSGLDDASKLVSDTSLATSHFTNINYATADNQPYTQSVFLKSSGLTEGMLEFRARDNNTFHTFFNIDDLTVGTNAAERASIKGLSDGWAWCQQTQNANVGATTGRYRHYLALGGGTNFDGDGVSGNLAYGYQAEALPYATSLVPTAGATVSRARDVFTADVSGWYSNDDGYVLTLKGRVHRADAGAVQTLAEYYDLVVEQNAVRIEITSDGKAQAEITGANISRAVLTSVGAVNDNTEFTIAIQVSTTQCALQLDSETPVTQVPLGNIIPTGINAAVHKADRSGGKEASMHLAEVIQQPGATL